ncbi:MAG: AI-2E family transporter, partial [Bdellovibrionales bacterium]|nr:AI-2E family transporter [Oligoflexia bacterium]
MWIESGLDRSQGTRQKTRLALSLILVALLVALFSSFLVPICLAGIFSLALEPFISRVVKPHGNRRASSFGLLVGLYSLIMVPILLISVSFYSELSTIASTGVSKSAYYQFFTESRERFISWTNDLLPKLSLQPSVHGDQLFDRIFDKTYEFLTRVASLFMSGLPSFLLSLFVFSVAIFFFISQSRKIKRFLLSLHL